MTDTAEGAAGAAAQPQDAFIAAASFQGSKEGYAFKQGDLGLGYYRDEEPNVFALDANPVWMYCGVDESGAAASEPKGPVTLQQLRESDPAVAALLWKHGLAAWIPRAEAIEMQKWFYLNPALAGTTAPQAGPFWVEQLAKQFDAGAVDQRTQMWCEGMDSWKPLIELPDLETFLNGIIAQAAPPPPSLDEINDDVVGKKPKKGAKKQDEKKDSGNSASHGKRKITDVYQGPAEGEAKSFVADDGTRYAWDDSSKKWITALGDDPQKNTDGTATAAPTDGNKPKRKRKTKKKARQKNESSIYVTGLDPETVDEEELEQLFSKYGIIKTSIFTGGPSITIYRNDNEIPKGDATIVYLKKESVPLAVQLVDGVEYRPGFTLNVKKAEWNKKDGTGADGDAKNAKKKPQYRMTQAEMKLLQKQIAARERKLLSWADGPDDDDMAIVILKHCFEPEELEDEKVENDVKQDLRKGCEPFGTVLKVSLMKFNPEGVAIVKFEDPEAAQSCVAKLNGRYFGRRQLEAMLWDGITDYNVKESEESKKRRLAEFGKWIEDGAEGDDGDVSKSTGNTSADQVSSGSSGLLDSASAQVPMPKLSAAGQSVADAAEELLSTATDSMLESYITAKEIADIKALVESTQEWLRQNPSPNSVDAAQKKRSLTDNPIIARVLAAMS